MILHEKSLEQCLGRSKCSVSTGFITGRTQQLGIPHPTPAPCKSFHSPWASRCGRRSRTVETSPSRLLGASRNLIPRNRQGDTRLAICDEYLNHLWPGKTLNCFAIGCFSLVASRAHDAIRKALTATRTWWRKTPSLCHFSCEVRICL